MWMSVPVIKSKPLELVFDIPISRTKEFWDSLEQGELFTTRCKECKKLHFPPVSDCPDCSSSMIEWVKLDGSGEIEAFTHVVARPASFQQHDPYTIVICRLVDGVKILAWLKGDSFFRVILPYLSVNFHEPFSRWTLPPFASITKMPSGPINRKSISPSRFDICLLIPNECRQYQSSMPSASRKSLKSFLSALLVV